jgi:hypothetical protein
MHILSMLLDMWHHAPNMMKNQDLTKQKSMECCRIFEEKKSYLIRKFICNLRSPDIKECVYVKT